MHNIFIFVLYAYFFTINFNAPALGMEFAYSHSCRVNWSHFCAHSYVALYVPASSGIPTCAIGVHGYGQNLSINRKLRYSKKDQIASWSDMRGGMREPVWTVSKLVQRWRLESSQRQRKVGNLHWHFCLPRERDRFCHTPKLCEVAACVCLAVGDNYEASCKAQV